MGGGLLSQGLREEGEILFYLETLFIGDSRRCVKEGSGNGASLSLCGSSVWGTWRGAALLGTLRDM